MVLAVWRLSPGARHTAPGAPGHGGTPRCRRAGLVRRRLAERVDAWRGDVPHVMALLANAPGPGVGTPTRGPVASRPTTGQTPGALSMPRPVVGGALGPASSGCMVAHAIATRLAHQRHPGKRRV